MIFIPSTLIFKLLSLNQWLIFFIWFLRRTLNEQLLHTIKEEGAFNIMHTLLVYLQTALQDQCPIVAGLLLQLDLLVGIHLSHSAT